MWRVRPSADGEFGALSDIIPFVMPEFILNEEEIAELNKPVRGIGGYEALLRRLHEGLNQETGAIQVSERDTDRIRQYCADYGQGGFQDRLARIFHRVLGVDLPRRSTASQ